MIPPQQVIDGSDVVEALRALGRLDAAPLSQGLSAPLARRCLDVALAPLQVEPLSLAASAAPHRSRPRSVAVVVAHGVFTSPIEWVALYATAGIEVGVKAPSADPALCAALVGCLQRRGLPVRSVGADELGGFEVIVVFGSDETVAALRAAHPGRRVVGFGHRVSAALVDVPADRDARRQLARALSWDVAAYDSRGCMAPVAILARGDAAALAGELHGALGELQHELPRGDVDPGLGPEWRRRLGLARARGTAQVGPAHAVLLLPGEHLVPAALPRMAVVHPVEGDPASAGLLLSSLPLSSIAATDAFREAAARLAPRVTAPGRLQQPDFPRRHDGVEMLGCVLAER
ncbi:MAG: hypothetical protein H6742_17280 [Alphaproteobacteria bacterium]|nr:hypothetical protein [Alphaproteobacteria bacterium]